jgi:predicted helicase
VDLTASEEAIAELGAERERALGREGRRAGGVVHTPARLARCVTRGADALLRDELGLAGGLGSRRLSLIDPACGPGAFLAAALAEAGAREQAPVAVVGLDRDAAAVAQASRLLAAPAATAGWPLTLRAADTLARVAPAEIAAGADVAVVLGNPPWIGARAQGRPTPPLRALLDDYRRDDDGAPLAERKLGVLADAYVRFVRWSAEVVARARGGGVLALVTNASYLDGPVHRAMRRELLRGFDSLYVLDLGGSALLSRRGARDDNLFGVRTPAAILLAARKPSAARQAGRVGRLCYRALRGTRDDKQRVLEAAPWSDAKVLRPAAPAYRFVPTPRTSPRYASWPALSEVFPLHREGVQTNRDEVVVDADRDRLLARLRAFVEGRSAPELEVAERPLPHYDPELARARVAEALARDGGAEAVQPLLYRPFDRRFFAAIAPLCHRRRPALARAMARSPVGLVTVRKDRSPVPWAHFGASDVLIDNCLLSTRSSCRARLFPSHDAEGRDNLDAAFANELARHLGSAVGGEEVVLYALSVIAAPAYRERHDAWLRQDYPRLPWPVGPEAFERGVALGRRMAGLLLASAREPAGGAVPVGEPVAVGHHRVHAPAARVAALSALLRELPDPEA